MSATTGNKVNIEIILGGAGAASKEFEKTGKAGESAGKKLDKSFAGAGRTISFFNKNVMDMAKGVTISQLALEAGRKAVRLFREEVTRGLGAVEDLNIKVASMAAFMSSFSQKSKDGDIAGGFKEASEYAAALIPRLEVLDAKTISTGKDLAVMVETMAMNGVVLDINNKKQETGFLNIANALKLVTAGQNADIQMRQEINALMSGQIRMTDMLPKLLQKIDPQLKEHIKQWKEEGTLIENVGDLLAGFNESSALISSTWTAIGSTMETIHSRVLRTGMKPMYRDLLNLANDTNRTFMDQDGTLTDIGQTVSGVIAAGWVDTKNTVTTIGNLLSGFKGPLTQIGQLTGMIFNGWGQIMAIMDPVSKRIGLAYQSQWDYVEMLRKGMRGDFAGAADEWQAGGALLGKVFAAGLGDEVEGKLNEYYAAKNIGQGLTVGQVDAPKMASSKKYGKQVEADRKGLGARLKEYEKFYADLDRQMEAHARKERQNILDLNNLYRQQMDLRRSTEEMLAGLGQATDRSAADEYALTRAELEQQYQASMMLGGQDQIAALEQYKQAVSDLAQEFKNGFDGTEASEISTQAINDIERAYELQKQVMGDLTTASEGQIETNRIWGNELANEAEKAGVVINDLKGTIADLDAQMRLMDQVLTIDAEDRASSVVASIQSEIDRLHDKTITLTTIHQDIISGAGSTGGSSGGETMAFADGGWIKEPVVGLGLNSGRKYTFGENEAELVTPRSKMTSSPAGGITITGGININIPETAAPQHPEDWRQITRDFIIPELESSSL